MVGEIPLARDSELDRLRNIAYLESWLVHVRLMAEFLLVHPSNASKDFSASDFGWDGKTSLDTNELSRMWLVASQHLVHFSRERAPEDVYALEEADVTTSGLIRISTLVLDLVHEFVDHLQVSGHADGPTFREHLDRARRALDGRWSGASP